jgi:PPOX class probable F420-dependent enzyme
VTATTPLDILGAAKYVSLTTFRADGTPVATPVWVVRDGTVLRILTDPASGKVRRIRANPAVRLSPCDMRGRVREGALVAEGTAVLEDEGGTDRTMAMIEKRYGLMGRIIGWLNSRRARKTEGGQIRHVGLSVTLA